jgi:hypothetical protein
MVTALRPAACAILLWSGVISAQINNVPGDPVVVKGRVGINTQSPSTPIEVKAPSTGET